MAKPRTCPHCKRFIPVDSGFYFDDQNNLICEECDKVVFPASQEGETDLEAKKTKAAVSTATNWNGAYGGHHPHHGGHGYGAAGVGLKNLEGDY